MNINVNNWKEFKVSSIFDIKTGGDMNPDDEIEGNIPVICLGFENNGICMYIEENEKHTLYKAGCITISAWAGGLRAFYQNKDFYVKGRLKIAIPKQKISVEASLFICEILNREDYRYSYGRKASDEKIPNTILLLPNKLNNDGTDYIDKTKQYSKDGYVPDWNYMTNFIKKLKYKPIKTKNNKKTHTNLNINTWQEFCIEDLFKIELSKGDIKAEEMQNGNIPLISSGETNNGIIKNIDEEGDGIATINDAKKITIDMFCNPFYQNKKFYSVSHGRVNILTPKFKIDEKIGLFLTTIIRKEKYKYSYGRAIYSDEAKKMIIKLPVEIKNNKPVIDSTHKYHSMGYIPNWDFMKNYIGSLPYGDKV